MRGARDAFFAVSQCVSVTDVCESNAVAECHLAPTVVLLLCVGCCRAVAGFLLLLMPEEHAFWMLETIVTELLPPHYYDSALMGKHDVCTFERPRVD